MVYMLKEMHEESGMGSLNISIVLNTIELCLIKGVILLVERNKEAVALMGLIPNALWWTDDKLLMDQFTFVRPEARKTKAIFKLVKEAKMIAKAEKMPLLIANFGYVNEEKVSKMYKRFGKSLDHMTTRKWVNDDDVQYFNQFKTIPEKYEFKGEREEFPNRPNTLDTSRLPLEYQDWVKSNL